MSVFNNIMSWIANPIGSVMSDRSKRGSTIWNNPQSENYKVDSLTESGNEFAGTGLDPNGFVSGLWNDLTGVTSQSREFAQQEYLMDKQNAYNLPAAQMERMKAAGINPNTAAQGISQGGNESAQSPAVASNENGVANGIGQAAAAFSGIASLGANIANLQAGAAAQNAAAAETNAMLPFKQGLFRAQQVLSFSQAGLADNQAEALEIENSYRGYGLLLDIQAKELQLPILRQTFKNLQMEYDFKQAEIRQIDQEILESGSRISLNEALALQARKSAAVLETQRWYNEQINKTMSDFNYDPRWSSNSILFGIASDMSISDAEAEKRARKITGLVYQSSYAEAEGAAKGDFTTYGWKRNADLSNEVSLRYLQNSLDKDLNKNQFKYDMLNKWIRVPSSAGVGPFKMSTE